MRPTICPVEYSLEYQVRRDEESKAFVAYIPMLQLSTCSQAEDRLKNAIHDLVVNFVTICRDRGILDDVMRKRGLQKMSGQPAEDLRREARESGKGQYIRVENEAREHQEIPLMFLAGKQALAACHQ